MTRKEDKEPESPYLLARAYCTNCPDGVYDKDPVVCVSLENDEGLGMAMYCHECISAAYAAFLVASAEEASHDA